VGTKPSLPHPRPCCRRSGGCSQHEAPSRLESEIVALGQPGDAITAGQFAGEEAPPRSYFEGLVAAICCRWLEDGKPKAIVRVPPMRGGRSGTLVSRRMQALASRGARVLDATGTGAADKQRFLTGLEAEKNRTYATSAYDVMVGTRGSWRGPTGRCAVLESRGRCPNSRAARPSWRVLAS
jgi:hypothetical protein